MTKRLHAARCISPRTASDGVWITDDLLADTFRRFTNVFVRHGSHVPGPLEARRRTAKRRNTNLAHFGAPQVDPTILFSKKPQSGWWKDDTVAKSKPSISALPAWLLGPQKTTHVDLSAEPDQLDFEGDLACCETLSDLRSLLFAHGSGLRFTPTRAEQIYEHVASQNWPASQYAQYLTEPALHPSGCANHLKFLRSFKDKASSPHPGPLPKLEDWATILGSICKAVRLGLFSAREWKQAVDTTLAVQSSLRGSGNHSPPVHWTMSPSLSISALLDSLEQCAVLSLKDVPLAWLSELSGRLLDCDLDTTTVKLLWRLRGEYNSRAIVDLYISWLERRTASFNAAACADALLQLPRVPLLQTVRQVTGVLTVGVLERRWEPSVLSAWAQILQSLNSETLIRVDVSREDIEHVRYNDNSSLERPQRALLLVWTLHQIFACAPAKLELLNCFRLLDRAFKQHGLRNATDFQCELLMALQSLPLPNKTSLLADLPRISGNRIPTILAERPEPKIGEAYILRGDLAHLADDATYRTMRQHHLTSLTQVVEWVNEDLDKFKRLIWHLTYTNKYSFRVITRILRHNLAFKMALSSAWPLRLEWQRRRNASTLRNPDHQPLPLPKNPKPCLDPEQVLDVIHIVAMAFSVSPAVSPRTALQKVLWCYKFLLHCNAPIQPPITRALWHAGVTRFYETGRRPSRRQRSYILKLVRGVEGPEVAKLLMRSPNFRKWRTASLESIAHRELPAEAVSAAPNLQPSTTAGSAPRPDPRVVKDLEYAQDIERRVTQIMEQEWARKAATADARASDGDGVNYNLAQNSNSSSVVSDPDLDQDAERARQWRHVWSETRRPNPWTVRRSSRGLDEILRRRGWHKLRTPASRGAEKVKEEKTIATAAAAVA